jgi:hypothetical protein
MSAERITTALGDRRREQRAGQPLHELEVTLTAERRHRRDEGIVLRLELRNETRSELRIVNPLDTLQLLILDAEGFPVTLPRGTPPRLLINTVGDEIERPYRILGVEGRGDDAELLRHVDDEITVIPAESTYAITIAVDRILTRDEDDAEPRPIPAGDYRVQAKLTLLSRTGDGAQRSLASEFIDVSVVEA